MPPLKTFYSIRYSKIEGGHRGDFFAELSFKRRAGEPVILRLSEKEAAAIEPTIKGLIELIDLLPKEEVKD